MTTWTNQNTIETGWASESNIVQTTGTDYNTMLAYNVDYLTYDGYYIQNEINWNASQAIETAWAES